MIHDGQVYGLPLVDYTDTQANIEALADAVAGMTAYASDENLFGRYNGTTWYWLDSSVLQSVINRYLALPALRGFWPMSSMDYTAANRASDMSGQGYHLTDNNTIEFGYDGLAPYVHFTLANSEYLSRADGGAGNWADILGTETEVLAAYRGLTLGGWFYFDGAAAAVEVCIAKWTAGADRSYQLFREATGEISFRVRNAIGVTTATSTITVSASEWVFLVGRFIPSTSIDVFINGDETNNAVAVIASIQDGVADFTIGATGTPSNHMDGRASMCFLCAAQFGNAIILSLFEQTRALFGV